MMRRASAAAAADGPLAAPSNRRFSMAARRSTANPVMVMAEMMRRGHSDGVRALLFCVVYIALGCVFYRAAEGWSTLEGAYFVVTTITTVGYGAPSPVTRAGRIFTMFYAFVGIGLMGSAIGQVAQWFMEQHAESKRRAEEKQMKRTRDLARRLAQQSFADVTADIRTVTGGPGASGKLANSGLGKFGSSTFVATSAYAPKKVRMLAGGVTLTDGIGSEEEEEEEGGGGEGEAGDLGAPTPTAGGATLAPPRQQRVVFNAPPVSVAAAGAAAARSRRRVQIVVPRSRSRWRAATRRLKRFFGVYDTFKSAGRYMERDERFRATKAVLARLWPAVVVTLLGMGIGMGAEGWCAVDSLYFSVITITTVGLGDLAPTSDLGRALAIAYLPLGVVAVTNTLGTLAELKMQEGLAKAKTPEDMLKECIEVIAMDNDGTVTREEYMIHMLLKMAKVDDVTLELLSQQFDMLDADGSGSLDADDIELLSRRLPGGGTASGAGAEGAAAGGEGKDDAEGGGDGGGGGAKKGKGGGNVFSSVRSAGITLQAVATMKKFAENKRRESMTMAAKVRQAGLLGKKVMPMLAPPATAEGDEDEDEEDAGDAAAGGGCQVLAAAEAAPRGAPRRVTVAAPRTAQLLQEEALLAEVGAAGGGGGKRDTIDGLIEEIVLDS
jgi:voltage-gated potassium channel